MISLRATTFGDAKRMRGMVQGLKVAAGDFRAASPKVVETFRKQESRLWATQGASGAHGKWAELKPSYAIRKARLFARRPILYLSGALRDSLAGESEGTLVAYFPNAVFIGTSLPYAQFLADGAAPLAGPRRAIDPTDRDVSEWVVAVMRVFQQASSRLGWAGRFQGAMS